MKIIRNILLFAALAVGLRGAVGDVNIQQVTNVSPPATATRVLPAGTSSLWGFDVNGRPVKITIGSNLAFDTSTNTLSSTGGGGGGVNSIIAGTNVTISSTGGGGTGDVTINSSGGGGGGSPGGSNTQVQFNDSGSFGGSSLFTFNKSTGATNLTGALTASSFIGPLTGNATTATAWATGRTISITGDMTYTSGSLTGAGNVTGTGTLASVATAGTTGSSTAIPVITIDVKGRTTSITTAAVIAPAGTLTGTTLASNVTASSLTSAAGGIFGTNAFTSTSYQPLATNLTSLAGLSYASLSFVKMSASGTFSLDTNTYLTANQTITLSGDVTGSGTTAITTTLATVNSNVGSFGSSTSIPSFTVNAKGLVTAASVNVVIAPAGTLTGTTLASNVTAASLTSLGTIANLTATAATIGGIGFSSSGDITNVHSFGVTDFSATNFTLGALTGVLTASSGVVSVTTATGTGAPVRAASPTLVTPILGVATATSINGNTFTTGSGTLTLGAGKTATISNTLTFTGTDTSSVNFGAGGTVLYSGGSYVSSITGTSGQIVASAATGAVTLSLPAAVTGVNSVTSATGQPLTFATGTSGTALTIASATNNVGIGLTDPSRLLHLASTGTLIFGVESTNTSSAAGPLTRFMRSRGTHASPADVQNGDNVGGIQGQSYSGTQFFNGGEIDFVVDGTFTTNQRPPSRMEVYTNAANTAQTLALTIDSAQKAAFTGALSVTGHTTIEGVTSTGATGINKLVYDTTPTLVTPVLGLATGTSLALSGGLATGGATLSSSTSIITPASTTSVSSMRIPHGSAPTSPVNGDFWSTTSGFFGRVNGSTVGPFGSGSSSLASTYVGYGDGSNALTGEAAFAYTAASNTLTVGAVSLGAGNEASSIGPLVDSVDGTTPLNNINQVVASGTAYTLTTSYASVDFGTTDPVLTIANAGTYSIYVDVQTSLVSATTTTQSATYKLRRTNNTAADLAGSTFGDPLPVATIGTELGPSTHIGPIKYTTTNTNDSITVQGILSGALGAGTATVTACTITAIRAY